jgi:methyl-accepting chemotaxis protein
MDSNLDVIRRKASLLFIVLALFHTVLIFVLCLMRGNAAVIPTLMAAGCVALIGAGALSAGLQAPITRLLATFGLVSQISLILAVMSGSTWMIDIHMYYFAMLAMLAIYCDWRAIAVGTATIALHHLALNFLVPVLVFSDGADLGRVVLHAVIVLLEAGVLIWLTAILPRLLRRWSTLEMEAQSQRERDGHAVRLAEETARLGLEAKRRQTMIDLADRLDSQVRGGVEVLTGTVARLNGQAEDVASSTDQVGTGTETLVTSSTEADSAVQSALASMSDLNRWIETIGTHLGSASQVVDDAVTKTAETETSAQALVTAAGKIGQVVSLIQSIAAQTNLLALNATIEASRAGDAGRGFAVVANEVKNLASQTAKATEDIQAQVVQMQSATHGMVEANRGITEVVGKMNDYIDLIAGAASEQAATTTQINQHIGTASRTTRELSSVARTLSSKAHGSVAGAHELRDFSQKLHQESDRMRQEVSSFVTSIRAT